MSACEDLAHTGAAYSAIEQHRACTVVLIMLAFVPPFELANFFKGGFGHLPSSWCSLCAVCSSTSCLKLHLSIWEEQCSLYQLRSITLSMISLPICSVDETL